MPIIPIKRKNYLFDRLKNKSIEAAGIKGLAMPFVVLYQFPKELLRDRQSESFPKL